MFPIESEDALWALVALVVAFGIYCERFTRLGRQVGAAMIIIAVGAVLSNLNLVASSSPVYDTLTGPVTSLAIVWLVMSVDLRQLRYAGRAMSIAFGLAVFGLPGLPWGSAKPRS